MRFFCFILLLTATFSCSNTNTTRNKLIHYTPENTSIIVKTNNIESLNSTLSNNNIIETLESTNTYKSLHDKLKNLSLFEPEGDILICFSKDHLDSLQLTLITKYNKNILATDSLKNYVEETLTSKNSSIIKSTLNNSIFYSTIIDSTFISSTSKEIIDLAHEKQNIDNELEKIYNTTGTNKTTSFIIKSDTTFIKSFFVNGDLPFNTFSNYMALDADVGQNQVLLHGITQALDSSKSFINVFKNLVPQENKIQDITPLTSDGFLSFTYNNFKNFEANLNKFNKKDSLATGTSLFDNISEVGVIYEGDNRSIALNSLDIIATKDQLLSELSLMENYREVEIYSFSKPELFSDVFHPLITSKNLNQYCVLDNFFVFANDADLLKSIITSYQNKTVLGEQHYFKDIKEQLNDASSLMLVLTPPLLKNTLEENLGEPISSNFKPYNTSALQFIYDTNFAHVNAIIKEAKAKASSNSISEELNIKLDNDLLNTPQFVTNHYTSEQEIVVQDIKNNLYLISNKGKILWKKQLEGPVLGNIEQIDIYKNGKLQLIFATPHRVYVIDRNGKDVTPFPGKFNDLITQPLSVFDYDKNKNYRLLVTQGKNVLMYDVDAKIVRGFTFKSAEANIISQPQHIRIGRKDYLLFKTESKLYILDRTGRTRVTPKTSLSFSSEPVFLYNNKFTTTTNIGDLLSIDTNGNVASVNLNLSENHHIDATSKTLATLSENKLTIRGKTFELDFGSYTAPKIFYINDKIYVSVTDLQSHKVYLFDSQADLLPNFPVYGNSSISLDYSNQDKTLELVVKGESNSIILYQIH